MNDGVLIKIISRHGQDIPNGPIKEPAYETRATQTLTELAIVGRFSVQPYSEGRGEETGFA